MQENYDKTDTVYLAGGALKNSHCRTAAYFLYGIEANTNDWFGYGISAGLASGYKDELATAPFVAFPYLRFGSNDDRISAKVIVLPHKDGLVGLSLNWKL